MPRPTTAAISPRIDSSGTSKCRTALAKTSGARFRGSNTDEIALEENAGAAIKNSEGIILEARARDKAWQPGALKCGSAERAIMDVGKRANCTQPSEYLVRSNEVPYD